MNSLHATGVNKKHQSVPKMRKAKSQSFRSRRNLSERSLSPQQDLAIKDLLFADNKGRDSMGSRTPTLQQPPMKSPTSISQTMGTQTTRERHETLRLLKGSQNSFTGSMILSPGRHSPLGFTERDSHDRRNPLVLSSDHIKSSNELSPKSAFARNHSKLHGSGGSQRSPIFRSYTQLRSSPTGGTPVPLPLQLPLSLPPPPPSPIDFAQQKIGTTSTGPAQDSSHLIGESASDKEANNVTPTSSGFSAFKRPSINLFTSIYFGGDKKSPLGPIPPITISNPQESNILAVKQVSDIQAETVACPPPLREEQKCRFERDASTTKTLERDQSEKKSVMRKLFTFGRKPSKYIATGTNRFAHAFTKAESNSPLIRQSTFAATPAASSSAAKSAVTKQMSETGVEPKISFKLSNYAKMSLKVRKSKPTAADGTAIKIIHDSNNRETISCETDSDREPPTKDVPFELDNVYFEKVGESYIKHEKKSLSEFDEDEDATQDNSKLQVPDIDLVNLVEEINNSVKLSSMSSESTQLSVSHYYPRRSESREPIEPRISEERESDSNDIVIPEDFRAELSQILKGYNSEPIYINLDALRKETDDAELTAKQHEPVDAATDKSPMQCPKIEFEPASRRSSFNHPRSPLLKSPGTERDTDFITLHKLDSGGDSFEMIEGDRKSSRAESSFECPYSSRETSFDISRYQSTSYEDQSSSFEIVDMDDKLKKSSIDLRKSSIELLDVETFQRSSSSYGRKSSLETHFDYTPSQVANNTPARSPNFPVPKKQSTENFRTLHISRPRSPLSNQTSSNFSSRDSYESSSSCAAAYGYHSDNVHPQSSPHGDLTKKHFPMTIKGKDGEIKTFLCADQRCGTIFEPRPSTQLTKQLSIGSALCRRTSGNTSSALTGFSSGSEFEPPSPRRASSASPKHTFTFRIVLKKVESSPGVLYYERHRSRIVERYRRRDSRRKRLQRVTEKFF